MNLAGRNAPCPCGSGRKYKKCCAKNEPGTSRTARPNHDGSSPVEREQTLFEAALPAEAPPATNAALTLVPPSVPASEGDPFSKRTKKIDRETVDGIIESMSDRLGQISKQFGLDITIKRATYSEINAKLEIEFATVRDDGVVMDRLAEEFLDRCGDFGFVPDDLGRPFQCGSELYRIIGLKPRAKLAVVCQHSNFPASPKRVQLSVAAVHAHLALPRSIESDPKLFEER